MAAEISSTPPVENEPTASAIEPVEPAAPETYGPPTGALAFSLVVLVAFALYWLVTYLEIVVGRQ